MTSDLSFSHDYILEDAGLRPNTIPSRLIENQTNKALACNMVILQCLLSVVVQIHIVPTIVMSLTRPALSMLFCLLGVLSQYFYANENV